jgi:hypothetical protein
MGYKNKEEMITALTEDMVCYRARRIDESFIIGSMTYD